MQDTACWHHSLPLTFLLTGTSWSDSCLIPFLYTENAAVGVYSPMQ